MKKFLFVTVGGAMLAATLLAQSQQYGKDKVDNRRENQQDRIANGVKDGQLTTGEAGRLEHHESRLNRQVRRDRVQNGGNLTNNEKNQINREQNGLSKEIRTDNHDAAHQVYGNNEVGRRRENQQDRIAQGIKSGSLTAGEASRLDHQEKRINQEDFRDRRANGGNLTNRERRQINRQQNRESGRIFRKKHN